VLQQDICIQYNQSRERSLNDKQWWGSEDHQEMQDTRLQVFGLIQQENHHEHHLPQEPYQVLSGNL
jgi:hypothetical protein